MTPDAFTTKVVGVSFCENYPQSIFGLGASVATGSLGVTLERDKLNTYDENAIKVKHDNLMLGHIPKFIASVIASEIDNGKNWFAEVESILVSAENPEQPGLKLRLWRQQ
jgi:hypothetical protein